MRRSTGVLIAAGVAVAAVLSTPALLGRLAADRLSTALGTTVSIGAVAWNPFSGRWMGTDVRVRGAHGGSVFRARRVRVRASLRDVLAGDERRIREVLVDDPQLTFGPAADGYRLDLPLAPTPGTPSTAWPLVRLDRVEARHGVVVLDDADGTKRILRVRHVRFRGTSRAGGAQGHVDATARLGDAAFVAHGGVRVGAGSHRVRLRVKANDVPLASAVSLAGLDAGREFAGRVRLDGVYDAAAHGSHRHRTARGKLAGTDVGVGAGGERGLQVSHVAVSRFRVDLERRAVAIEQVGASGGEARLRGIPDRIRVAGLVEPGRPEETSEPSWTVTVAGLTLRDTLLRQLDGDEERLQATITELNAGPFGPGGHSIPLTLAAELPAGGRLHAAGELATSPLTLRVRLRAEAVVLPPLVAAARLPVRLESGQTDATLDLVASAAGVRVAGKASIDDLKTMSPEPARPEHVLACKRLELAIDRAELQPFRASLGRLSVEWPYVFVDRTAEGVFPLSSASGPGAPEPVADAGTLRIDELAVTGGRVDFRDERLAPPYWRSLTGITAQGRAVTVAPTRIARLSLDGLVDELSPLHLEGTIGSRTELRVEVKQLALPPFNPYLSDVSSYAVSSGLAEVTSEIVIDRSALEATNRVVLSRLGVQSGGRDDVLQQQLGLPLTLAIALMKDYRGNIALALPLGGDLASPTFSLRSAILQAVVQAVRGAILSPLNALGRVFLRDGRIERFTLAPVPFPAGSRALDAGGAERLSQVARVLQTRPDLALEVRGTVAGMDVEHLEDEAALAALGTGRGTDALQSFLRARLAGEPPPDLDAEEQSRLATLRRSLPWPATAARALAVDRANTVAATLAVEHGLGGERVAVLAPGPINQTSLVEAPAALLSLHER